MMNTITMTTAQFDALPEYSCSIPTGTTKGKRLKRKRNYYDVSKGWEMGEYGEPFDDPCGKRFCKRVPITWSLIEIRDPHNEDDPLPMDELTEAEAVERCDVHCVHKYCSVARGGMEPAGPGSWCDKPYEERE